MACLIPAPGWEAQLGMPSEGSNIPQLAICQLSGVLMTDPVTAPGGQTFDRAALEDWMAHSATNPVTGTPLTLAECGQARELQAHIQGYQMQMMSACEIAPEAFEQPAPHEEELAEAAASPAPAPVPAPPMPAAGFLGLADLPSLSKEQQKKDKREKSKIRIESRSVVECPDEMRCRIDGKVVINPVRSPYGHLFEKKTLERWLNNCGSVCPITGQPLALEDCLPDAEMKKQIVRFLKGQQAEQAAEQARA
eukprot:NODE_1431_length_1143_cov_336.339154.p1 GENE.NODE_1431_length_1143_cov_336.339154~~NODE_1431_length_1143_cov_336.339154.p1  ORF type:complete len:259 (-),score=71.61 NODE_1431_length_1143_cov_336.339154:352-1104(-)